jgi:hypothetical protein
MISAKDQSTIEQVFTDAGLAIRGIELLINVFGLDKTLVAGALREGLPELTPGGPDEAAAYESAKATAEAKASGDTDPNMAAVRPDDEPTK